MSTRTDVAVKAASTVAAAIARRIPDGRQPPVESMSVGTLSGTPRVYLYVAEGVDDPFLGVRGVAEWGLWLATTVTLTALEGVVAASAQTWLDGYLVTAKSWVRPADAAKLTERFNSPLNAERRSITVAAEELIPVIDDAETAVA